MVLGVADGPTAPKKALHELCAAYWRPLYAFARRDGLSPEDAEDLVQGFLASIVGGPAIAGIERERGRFRSYLLGALRHYTTKERVRAAALKRGGDQVKVPLTIDRDGAEAALEIPDDRTPEGAYAYAWAMEILGRARTRLSQQYTDDGREHLYAALHPFLEATAAPAYRTVAATLDMSEANARVAVHRLRARFRDALRDEVADTVASAADIDDEIRAVIDAIRL